MPEPSLEKVPPQNLDAEMAVLGSMLIDEGAIGVAIENIDKHTFYSDSHRKVFDAIIDLYNANKAVDLITLTDELKKRNILEELGGVSFLTALVNAVPSSANINHYVGIVKGKSILRTLINHSTKIISRCYERQDNIEEVVDEAEKLIFEISEKRTAISHSPLKEIIKDSI